MTVVKDKIIYHGFYGATRKDIYTIDISLKHMRELFKNDPNFNEQDAVDNMKSFFPKLKRWA